MSKPRTAVRCADCGHLQPRWTGRCPACQAWGTMQPDAFPATGDVATSRSSQAYPIGRVPLHELDRISTGISEVDRVLGGGLVPGVVALIAGEPGIGKSTLLLQIADRVASAGREVLYVSGEESAVQVRLRAERLGALSERLLVASETSLDEVLGLIETHRPAAFLLDSIQTISTPRGPGSAGSVSQVRECALALVRAAKQTSAAAVLVGHVTKEGAIAGPRVLEHLVDAVLAFEGDRHHALRLLRGVKNRFGAAGEVGCLEIADDGFREVADPSRLFLAQHSTDPSGVAVTVAVEGPRPLTVEVQALVAASRLATPRRQASGLDATRLALLVAVLERRCGLNFAEHDLFASAVGGVRLREPAADLALCMALASSRLDRRLPRGLIVIGEVGLAGEVRAVPQLKRRLAEAARLGFVSALVPASHDGDALGLQIHPVRDVQDCIQAFLRDSVPLPVACPTP
ncbi:MAG: DNA repair protein RadA [Actinomycetota bacterium]|nr:DNA repair protein RadA [Actinomycetota bacterium]